MDCPYVLFSKNRKSRGKRWDLNEKFAQSSWYGTKNWTRPLQEEVPTFSNLVENGCYW